MDKFEYKVRADEILELVGKGEYAEAAEIADSIDWRRVKSVTMLCTISDLYKANKRYEDAKNVLLLAYERRPGGRTICYALCELCIKTEEFVQAVKYYKEFMEIAPKDPGRYVLHYKLLEAQDVSLEERIEVLEELKKADYREKWAYELAYLYHKVGQATRCVEECDELILWFGDGKYVYKAMELKMQHQALSEEQQAKYDHRFDKAKQEAEKKAEAEKAAEEAQAIAEGKTVVYPNGQTLVGNVVVSEADSGVVAEEEPEIQVKTMDVGQYNTINLQAELAAGLQEILRTDAITGAIMEPMMEPEEEVEVQNEANAVTEKSAGGVSEQEEIEETEVFFGETGEIGQIQPQMLSVGDTGDFTEITLESLGAEEAESTEREVITEELCATEEEVPAGNAETDASDGAEKVEAVAVESEKSEEPVDATAQAVMEQMRMENVGVFENPAFLAQPPKALAGVLSQDSDGQLRLVVPERETVEKQITGQLNIDDILAEWERMKQESEEKRKEEVRRHVQEQTGTMFTDFEAAIRDGLLEKLEKGEQVDLETLQVIEPENVDVEAEPQEVAETEAEGEPETDEVEEIEEIEEVVEGETTEEAVSEEALEETELEEGTESEEVSEEESEEIEEAETEESDEVTESEAEDPETDEVEEIEEVEEVVEGETTEEAVSEEALEETELEEGTESEEVSEEESEEIEEAETEESDEVTESEAEDTETDEVEEIEEIEEVSQEVGETEPVIERPKVRALTREERELYAPFIQSRSAKERLVTAIDNISMAAYTGNLVVTGEEGMDTMGLAKNIIREIQMTDSNFAGKVAKVSGEGLNQRSVAMTVSQLNNGALIIQKASGMSQQTVEDLHKALQQENLGIVVVIEDTKRAINNLFASYPKLESCFTARMDVEALSNDTLVAFGRSYARQLEYSIDELGVLALHTRIEEMQTSDHVVTVIDVKKIMDEAIHHATRKTLKHFMDVLFGKRYDDEDMIILTEKDFV